MQCRSIKYSLVLNYIIYVIRTYVDIFYWGCLELIRLRNRIVLSRLTVASPYGLLLHLRRAPASPPSSACFRPHLPARRTSPATIAGRTAVHPTRGRRAAATPRRPALPPSPPPPVRRHPGPPSKPTPDSDDPAPCTPLR